MKKKVEELIKEELEAACDNWPMFASLHEGYAVLQEEIEEAISELDKIEVYADCMWDSVKLNQDMAAIRLSKKIKKHAENLISEAVQVAAMAEKIILSEKQRKKQYQI